MELSDKKCVPCEGGVPKMKPEEIKEYNARLNTPWEVLEDMKIRRTFKFDNFKETMKFVNQIADLAEEEGHHPAMHVFYGKVEVEFWTHAIMGLSENDFIMAAKIEEL